MIVQDIIFGAVKRLKGPAKELLKACYVVQDNVVSIDKNKLRSIVLVAPIKIAPLLNDNGVKEKVYKAIEEEKIARKITDLNISLRSPGEGKFPCR